MGGGGGSGRNKAAVAGMSVVILLVVVAILAPVLAPTTPTRRTSASLQGPHGSTPGDGQLRPGHACRIIYGSRISLYVGFVAVGIGAIFGGILGAIGGYYGGRLDNIIMRCMDVLLAIPQIILAIAIVGVLGTSLQPHDRRGISQLPGTPAVRASALTVRGQEYVEAARAIGASDTRIILLENILPNCMAPIIVQSTLGVAQAILSAAALSSRPGDSAPHGGMGLHAQLGKIFLRNAPISHSFRGLPSPSSCSP
ncbi:hypothetical protein MASR2M79_22060 [Aminivibrio sp.]